MCSAALDSLITGFLYSIYHGGEGAQQSPRLGKTPRWYDEHPMEGCLRESAIGVRNDCLSVSRFCIHGLASRDKSNLLRAA